MWMFQRELDRLRGQRQVGIRLDRVRGFGPEADICDQVYSRNDRQRVMNKTRVSPLIIPRVWTSTVVHVVEDLRPMSSDSSIRENLAEKFALFQFRPMPQITVIPLPSCSPRRPTPDVNHLGEIVAERSLQFVFDKIRACDHPEPRVSAIPC